MGGGEFRMFGPRESDRDTLCITCRHADIVG